MKKFAMDSEKRMRYTRWGIMSSKGTERGKCRNEGSKTVKVGKKIDKVSFWGFSSFRRSLVFSITVIATRKLLHSRMMLVLLKTLIGKPYVVEVTGQKS